MEAVWLTSQLSAAIINNEIDGKEELIVGDITSDKLDLLLMVENMSSVLTNKEPENREKGMKIFSKVLELLPPNYLNEKQVIFISKFYIDRLKDNHRVIPSVLDGFLAIIEMNHFDEQCIGDFFTILFREVPCQSQTRVDRLKIYKIIQRLLDTRLDLMKKLGPDFVYGVITSIDGERDPRNLLFLFTHLPKFIRNIPLGHLCEEMFDIISCYYPIDFNPAQNDPEAVTRQALADHLAPCLCAVPQFAEFCMPLLIEKLDSALRIAKIDSLHLLVECCRTFKVDSFSPFLKTLWSSIQREISHKTDEELKLSAHKALYALVNKLSETENTDQSFENFVKGILISMQTVMADATTTQVFDTCCKVLLTCSNASRASCIIITKTIIPSIIAYYNMKFSEKLQLLGLDYTTKFFEIAKKYDLIDELRTILEEIPQLCLETISIPKKEFQKEGFKSLIKVAEVLPMDILVPLVDVLCYNVHNHEDTEVIEVCIRCIQAIAKKYPKEIMELVIRVKLNFDNLENDKDLLNRRLRVLVGLIILEDFTDVIMKKIVALLSVNTTDNVVVKVLSDSLSNNDDFSDEIVENLEKNYNIMKILLQLLTNSLENTEAELLNDGFLLVALIMRKLPSKTQSKIVSEQSEIIQKMIAKDKKYILISKCLYTPLRPNVSLQYLDTIVNESSKIALSHQNNYLREQNNILISHLLNKVCLGDNFDLVYKTISKNIDEHLQENIDDTFTKVIDLYGWIVKALVMRGHEDFIQWFKKIVEHLTQPSACKNAAEAIGLIVTDNPNYLNSNYHCNVSLFYKQRILNTFFELCKERECELKRNKESFLLSIAHIVSAVPRNVVKNEAGKLVPLIIDALAVDNDTLLAAMLDVMSYLTDNKHRRVADSLQTIVPKLVKLAMSERSMKVRMTSLDCLYNIANNCSTMLLLPFKEDVVFDLSPALDDRKRLVRSNAVKARCRWILVGAPGEE